MIQCFASFVAGFLCDVLFAFVLDKIMAISYAPIDLSTRHHIDHKGEFLFCRVEFSSRKPPPMSELTRVRATFKMSFQVK